MAQENTNGVDDALMMHFIRETNSLDAQISAIQGKRKNFRSNIKSYGVKLRNFDRVREQFNAQDGGDEALEDIREQRRLARLIDIPFGHQISFFDEDEQFDPEKQTSAGGAYEQGRNAFLQLAKESENPFSPNLAQGQDWLKGFHAAEDACKVGKEKAAVGPEKDEKPDAAKGTISMSSPKGNGKMAPASPRKSKPKAKKAATKRKAKGLGPAVDGRDRPEKRA